MVLQNQTTCVKLAHTDLGFEGLECSPALLEYTLAGDFMATFIALNGVCLNVPRHHHNILAGPGRCVLPAAPDAEFYRTLLRVFMPHHGPDFTTGSLIFSNTRL